MSRNNSQDDPDHPPAYFEDGAGGRKRSNSLMMGLLYRDSDGKLPDLTFSPPTSRTRVELLRMGSYGDILGNFIIFDRKAKFNR